MAVFVGYLLLVPSVIGILWSIASFIISVGNEATDVAVLGGGLSIATAIASVVGGLVGWLLVMKKRVLQCSVCGAVVNAS
jgi:membrane associated rhomboid family serine protease